MCGGVTTPALKVAANPLPISTREREIAALIAAGASNTEIAAGMSSADQVVDYPCPAASVALTSKRLPGRERGQPQHGLRK
jgi:FixJ family two-component response regulator